MSSANPGASVMTDKQQAGRSRTGTVLKSLKKTLRRFRSTPALQPAADGEPATDVAVLRQPELRVVGMAGGLTCDGLPARSLPVPCPHEITMQHHCRTHAPSFLCFRGLAPYPVHDPIPDVGIACNLLGCCCSLTHLLTAAMLRRGSPGPQIVDAAEPPRCDWKGDCRRIRSVFCSLLHPPVLGPPPSCGHSWSTGDGNQVSLPRIS